MIVNFPVPEVQVLQDDVALSLSEGCTVLLTTTTTIDRLLAALHEARELVVQQERARSERAEHLAARVINRANEGEHREWGSTLSGTVTPTETVVRKVTFTDCMCSRFFVCDKHMHGDVA